MTAALARLDRTMTELVAAHRGVRPVEQGEGDSFVLAFTRASDAVPFALDLQRSPLAPIRLRIGIHTGEIQLRDEGNYRADDQPHCAAARSGPRRADGDVRRRPSGPASDRPPAEAWLTDLGTHQLRDFPRPERVAQLCHPDLRTEFPPLRTPKVADTQTFRSQFTNFIGRGAQMAELRRLLVRQPIGDVDRCRGDWQDPACHRGRIPHRRPFRG